MKMDNILTFIIGVLTGCIIMTIVFLFIIPNNNIRNGRGEVPPGGFGGGQPNGQMGNPPEMPNGGMMPQQQVQ